MRRHEISYEHCAAIGGELLILFPVRKETTSLLNALTRPLRFGLALGLCAGPMLMATPAVAAQTLVVSAGAESPGGDVQLNAFAPNMINVNVGDTVTWHLDSTEFHNIFFPSGTTPPEFVLAGPDGVFLNPQAGFPTGGPNYDGSAPAGSGLLNKGDAYSLTFTKAGNYQFLCDIHAGMGGIVNVTAAGGAADSQAAVDVRRTSEINSQLANKGIPAIMSNLGELPTEGSSAGIAAGVQSGWTEASTDATRAAIRGLSPTGTSTCGPLIPCMGPASTPTNGMRATVDARLTFFAGLLGFGVARPVDRAAPWRFAFRVGQEY
jgi:plastocyanin